MTESQAVVLVVDDDLKVRTALTQLLEDNGYQVRSFSSAEEFLKIDDRPAIGCLLLDLRLPGLDGLELQKRIGAEAKTLPIVFISGDGDVPTTARAMKRGAVDFLTKPPGKQELLEAVGLAMEQSRKTRERERELTMLRKRLATLSSRQTEVLHLVLTGMLNKQVAAELGITEKTVKFHRGQVMKKLRVGSVAELVRLSERAGLFTPSGS